MKLTPVKELRVIILVDNYVDILLPSDERVKRPPVMKGEQMAPNPIAEHGLSLLLDVEGERFIMDFGLTDFGLLHNMEVLGIDPKGISFGVVSHGHHDHLGALFPFLQRVPQGFPLYIHEEAFLPVRYITFPSGDRVYFPRVERERIAAQGAEIRTVKGPTPLLNGKALLSGEIPRITEYEKGLPGAFCEKEGKAVPDKIADDMALYFLLEGKGLVVVSGCAHSGIINTTLYGRGLTGMEKVYAILGGFHLAGPGMQEVIPKTITALEELSPAYICPMHCTGWKGQRKLQETFGERFILSSSGSIVTL